MQSYDTIYVVRGEPIRLRVAMVKDGVPWIDVEDYDGEAELRHEADSLTVAGTFDLTYDGSDMTMTLPTIGLNCGTYVADVDFYDPDIEDRDLARFTWPGADWERLTFEIVKDATRVPAPTP